MSMEEERGRHPCGICKCSRLSCLAPGCLPDLHLLAGWMLGWGGVVKTPEYNPLPAPARALSLLRWSVVSLATPRTPAIAECHHAMVWSWCQCRCSSLLHPGHWSQIPRSLLFPGEGRRCILPCPSHDPAPPGAQQFRFLRTKCTVYSEQVAVQCTVHLYTARPRHPSVSKHWEPGQ